MPAHFLRPQGRVARLCACVASILLAACASLCALAAPLAPPRPAPGPLAPLAPRASAAPRTPIDAACGTGLDALPEAYAAFAEHAALAAAPLPTPHSTDAGEVAVLEDDGTFFYVDKGGNPNLDVAAVARAFYRTHGDDYDQLVLWLATGLTNWLGSPTALAAAWPVRNSVSGIGLSTFVYNADLGAPPRLQTVLTMNGLQKYPDDPAAWVPGLPYYVTQDVLAHEFGHQWLAYPMVQSTLGPSPALLGRGYQHWSFFFDADGSVMEGPDWVQVGPDTFASLPPIARYGPFDHYLMGVRPRDEVGPLLVISDTATFDPPGPFVPYSDPNEYLTARGPFAQHTIDDVEAANGPRVPDAAGSPHALRAAFALIVPRGSAATAADLAKVETIRAAFPATVDEYTGGRMSLDATLDSRAGRLLLEHTGLPDTEAPGVPRPVSLRVTVEQAGIPIGVDPSGSKAWWRIVPNTLWNPIPMAPAGPDTFTADLPPCAIGETLQYRFTATSDSAGIDGALPDPGTEPFSTFTGPDDSPPSVTHWEQPLQALERLPQTLLARVTDNLGVDSVWCEFSLEGGPIQSVPAAQAGLDSFTVSIGAGAVRGSAIAYRFAARDGSIAGNIGYSHAAFDTLRVGYDWLDGVWNPGPWTHGIVRFNRRDEWHPVETQAWPSGSAAWHCGLDSLPYGPYQDAALASALVYGIAPGCTLTFAHRYDLEDAPPDMAFDGVRVEIQPNGGAWDVATPVSDYSHHMALGDQGFPAGTPCWSGGSSGWREESIDLSPYAPGPVRVRFRMSTDTFVGRAGWWVDQIRFHFPSQSTAGVGRSGADAVALGPLWPNPASTSLHQSLRLSRAARVDWALYDLAGRRVVTLRSGPATAGSHEFSGALPRSLAGGIYFSRVTVDGRALPARRVAVIH